MKDFRSPCWTLHTVTFSIVNIDGFACPVQHEVCCLHLSVPCFHFADVSDVSTAGILFNFYSFPLSSHSSARLLQTRKNKYS